MLLGAFLCGNSLAGCLRGVQRPLVFSYGTHVWGAASCGRASCIRRVALIVGWQTLLRAHCCSPLHGVGGGLEVLGHHLPLPGTFTGLPARPQKMRATPSASASSPRRAGLCALPWKLWGRWQHEACRSLGSRARPANHLTFGSEGPFHPVSQESFLTFYLPSKSGLCLAGGPAFSRLQLSGPGTTLPGVGFS